MQNLPTRTGPRPQTTVHNPHRQLNQNGAPEVQDMLIDEVLALDGVKLGDSVIAGENARAFILDNPLAQGPDDAFFGATGEFAHIHEPTDGSLHVRLPLEEAEYAVGKGWGEAHPMGQRMGWPMTNIMIYCPRDRAEVATIMTILQRSYSFACGADEEK